MLVESTLIEFRDCENCLDSNKSGLQKPSSGFLDFAFFLLGIEELADGSDCSGVGLMISINSQSLGLETVVLLFFVSFLSTSLLFT